MELNSFPICKAFCVCCTLLSSLVLNYSEASVSMDMIEPGKLVVKNSNGTNTIYNSIDNHFIIDNIYNNKKYDLLINNKTNEKCSIVLNDNSGKVVKLWNVLIGECIDNCEFNKNDNLYIKMDVFEPKSKQVVLNSSIIVEHLYSYYSTIIVKNKKYLVLGPEAAWEKLVDLTLLL